MQIKQCSECRGCRGSVTRVQGWAVHCAIIQHSLTVPVTTTMDSPLSATMSSTVRPVHHNSCDARLGHWGLSIAIPHSTGFNINVSIILKQTFYPDEISVSDIFDQGDLPLFKMHTFSDTLCIIVYALFTSYLPLYSPLKFESLVFI